MEKGIIINIKKKPTKEETRVLELKQHIGRSSMIIIFIYFTLILVLSCLYNDDKIINFGFEFFLGTTLVIIILYYWKKFLNHTK